MGWDGGERYSVPIRWLGLRPGQVRALRGGGLPKEVYQKMTDVDRKKVEGMLVETNEFVNEHGGGGRGKELEDMVENGWKVELESLHWLGMEFMSSWLKELLVVNQEWMERGDDVSSNDWHGVDDDENYDPRLAI